MKEIGEEYEYGTLGSYNGDYKRKAAEWFRKGAELGNADAQVNYGDLFEKGYYFDVYFISGELSSRDVIVEKDIEQAKFWWRKAAAQGNKIAKDRLQKIYE